jgi:hypothetical protein
MSDDMTFASDDELLSAYIDGVLPAPQREALARRLQREPGLASQLERLEQANRAVHAAYATAADEPLPQSVLDLLDGTEQAMRPTADVVDLGARRPVPPPRSFPWPAALAASVTLALGIALGYQLSSGVADPELALLARAGVVEPGTSLHAVLETGASGSIHDLNAELRAMPILSFPAQNGEFCRQVELGSNAASAEALACRRAGTWQLEAMGFLPDRPFSGNLGGFRPAGAGSNAIDAVVDERIVGDPLDAASERALIEAGWIAR